MGIKLRWVCSEGGLFLSVLRALSIWLEPNILIDCCQKLVMRHIEVREQDIHLRTTRYP